jgi:hypothetical protein
MSTKNPLVEKSAAVAAMGGEWELVTTLLGGTTAMRAAGKRYLPQFAKEEDEAYEKRLKRSVLFPAFKRTISTLSGKPFSKALTLSDDTPSQLREYMEDADQQGRNLHAFAADVFQTALSYGLGGILVEFPVAKPKPNGQPYTQAEEAAMGLRPYLVKISPHQLLGWRAERVNGVWQLTQLRFTECVTEADGAYGEKEIKQVRVLMPNAWEIHRPNAKGEWVLYDGGVNTLGKVPFVPVYGERLGFMSGRPPLIEVAHLNVAHWQSASDQQNILHVARVPILAVVGVDDDYKLVIGASSATKLPVNGDLKFVEHSGKAIEAGAADLKDLEERMRQAGAELLVLAPRVTATQVHTENALGACLLQSIVEDFEDALDQVLALAAEWLKLPQGGKVTLFKDFGAATLAEASAQLLLSMNIAGKLSDATLHGELQRRGILSSDLSWDDERERIESQGPAPGMEGGNIGQG